MNGYELSRLFWNFSFENPDLIKPAHGSVYYFAVEHCNRLGWAKKFGLPASMVMSACGIHSYNTYKKIFDNLVEWGFFELIQKSKNQYSSNIIALSNASSFALSNNDKALDKALAKHSTKQSESTIQSIDSISKQLTSKPITIKTNLEKAIDDFIAMRKKIKKPLTKRAIELTLSKLQKLAPGDEEKKIKILNNSIMNCWQGIFQLKDEKPQLTQPKRKPKMILTP